MTDLKVRVHSATFVAGDQPDTEARVLCDPFGGFSYSIKLGPDEEPLTSGLVGAGSEPQFAEALQFVADTISASIPGRLSPFTRGWINTASDVHHTAKQKGFWVDGEERNDGELLCLIHSEVSEALEALRKGNPPDDKIPEFSGAETELADAVIRIMDMAHARGWRVAQAIEAKIKFNETRPYKHGKEF